MRQEASDEADYPTVRQVPSRPQLKRDPVGAPLEVTVPTELNDSVVKVLTDLETDNMTGEALVAWALTAVEDGRDSPSLLILAGLPRLSPLSDAEPYFRRALDELHVQAPPRRDLLLQYLRVVARELLRGEVPAEKAADLIHSRVVSPLNHPAELQNWCYLWEGLHPEDFRSVKGQERTAALEAEARRWVA